MCRLITYCCVFVLLIVSIGCNPVESAFLSVDKAQCIGCAKCISVCKADALRIISNKAVIDLTKCTKCGLCVDICPVNAIY